jgi:hypothetical protein
MRTLLNTLSITLGMAIEIDSDQGVPHDDTAKMAARKTGRP